MFSLHVWNTNHRPGDTQKKKKKKIRKIHGNSCEFQNWLIWLCFVLFFIHFSFHLLKNIKQITYYSPTDKYTIALKPTKKV